MGATRHLPRSERLGAVHDLVLADRPVVDVGTDHARLAIALARSGRCPHVVACDRSADAVAGARAAVATAGVGDRVDVRLADGLAVLDDSPVGTVVIAGLGGRLIARILERDASRLRGVRRLVLAPQRDVRHVRRWLRAHAWRVVDERIVEERRRFYWVLAAEEMLPGAETAAIASAEIASAEIASPSIGSLEVDVDARLGSIARRRGDPAFRRFVHHEIRRLEGCVRAMQETSGHRAARRRITIGTRLEMLRSALAGEGPCTDRS